MRKLLLGCGCLVAIVVCVLVGVGMWGYFKVKTFVDNLEALRAAYVETNEAYPFTPPEVQVLEEGRFETFLAVRKRLALDIEDDMALLSRLMEATNKQSEEAPKISFRDLTDAAMLPIRVGNAHVEALNSEGMSVDEYLWYSGIVTATVVKAAEKGEDVAQGILDAYENDTLEESRDSGRISLPKTEAIRRILYVPDIPLLEENLERVNEAAGELSKYPNLLFLDPVLREWGFGSGFPSIARTDARASESADLLGNPEAETESEQAP